MVTCTRIWPWTEYLQIGGEETFYFFENPNTDDEGQSSSSDEAAIALVTTPLHIKQRNRSKDTNVN